MNTPNKIVQAFRESVEELRGIDIAPEDTHDINSNLSKELVGQLQSHHKHHTLNLLRAVKKGVGSNEVFDNMDRTKLKDRAEVRGYNTAKAEIRKLLNEAIKQIE